MKLFESFQPTPVTLMGPGPSDVHPRVLAALAKPTIGHLDSQFVSLMDQIKELLRYAFQTTNELTFAVSAPGSAGMETCFVNMVEPKDKVLIASNGVFSLRMKENVERLGASAIMVEHEWGRAIDIDKMEQALKDNPDISIMAFVHAETSTGALSNAKALCQLAQKYHCLTIVDAVTSLAGVPLKVDEWGIDAIYSGTQKCLSCIPGLSPVSFGPRAIEKIKKRQSPISSWFLDLNLVMDYWSGENKRTYHHTAPVNSMYALHESLLLLQAEGLENSWRRHAQISEELKKRLLALGLEYYVPGNEQLPQLSSIIIPEGIDDQKVRAQLLQDFQLEIGAGLGPLAGRIWRIGLMGHSCHMKNVIYCSEALKKLLH